MNDDTGATGRASRFASATHPLIYEINTWLWLGRLADRFGRPVDLGTVPDECWDELADLGFDAVWLMGVWERSPAGVAIALANPGARADFDAALPGWQPSDVVGSAYSVRDFRCATHLGGPEGLRTARAALARRGLGLILDFVPNHVAPDHPWITSDPSRFIRGTVDDFHADPVSYVAAGDQVFARGRDPYFPAWRDVVQLNAFAPTLRTAAVETVRSIASQCDGIRCDMAMLMLNDIFARTWGDRAGPVPAEEYWTLVIDAVRAEHPDFCFMAEAYWDLEWRLQQLGFDFCYDKHLYDKLAHESAEAVRQYLCADVGYQEGLVRFIENHDEPRAASVFDPARERAVAVAALTQTGARLVHEGQMEGRKVRVPVLLGRGPDEPVDVELAAFYRDLLHALAAPAFHRGRWQLCERSGWPGNESYRNLVAWSWEHDDRWLVVVNLGGGVANGHVAAPWDDLRGRMWTLTDPTREMVFERSGDDVRDGLYVELGPWEWHLFLIEPGITGGTQP